MEFETPPPHHLNAALDKLVKSLPFHGKDYGFEPRTLYDSQVACWYTHSIIRVITGSNPVLTTRLVVSDFPEEWNFQNSQVAEQGYH